MPDLPDFYMWTETTLAKVTSINCGLDADKATSPSQGEAYLATDTFYLYACFTAGSWESVAKLYLLLTGGTMSGAIDMGANKITGLANPTAAQDAATRAYVLAYAAALVHASRHQDLGADEISVTGLSGLLADDQHVLDAEVLAVAAALVHAARHQAAGADVISIAGLAGEPTELTTHKGLTTGVHGVGADYLAKVAGSQQLVLPLAGGTLTGPLIINTNTQNGFEVNYNDYLSLLLKVCGTAASHRAMLELTRAKGSLASPAAILSGDYMGDLVARGYSADFHSGAVFGFFAAQDWSDAPNKWGTMMKLQLVPVDSGSLATKLEWTAVKHWPTNDNSVELGDATHRFKTVRAVTGTFGDMKLENGWGFTEHPEHGIVVEAPSGKTYKMHLEEV